MKNPKRQTKIASRSGLKIVALGRVKREKVSGFWNSVLNTLLLTDLHSFRFYILHKTGNQLLRKSAETNLQSWWSFRISHNMTNQLLKKIDEKACIGFAEENFEKLCTLCSHDVLSYFAQYDKSTKNCWQFVHTLQPWCPQSGHQPSWPSAPPPFGKHTSPGNDNDGDDDDDDDDNDDDDNDADLKYSREEEDQGDESNHTTDPAGDGVHVQAGGNGGDADDKLVDGDVNCLLAYIPFSSLSHVVPTL